MKDIQTTGGVFTEDSRKKVLANICRLTSILIFYYIFTISIVGNI